MYFIKDKEKAMIFIINSDREKSTLCVKMKGDTKYRVAIEPVVFTKKEIIGVDFSKAMSYNDIPIDILRTLVERSFNPVFSGNIKAML